MTWDPNLMTVTLARHAGDNNLGQRAESEKGLGHSISKRLYKQHMPQCTRHSLNLFALLLF